MKVGIYLGCRSDNPENIEKQLIAWSEYLDTYQLEGFGSAPIPESVADSIDHFDTTPRDPTNPVEKIFTALEQTREYIDNRNPDVVIQIWCYPTHAPGVTLAGRYMRTPTIVRFSGDHFQEYRSFNGFRKCLAFGLGNLIGRIPLRLAAKVITLGPYGKREVTSRGVPNSKVKILPPATGRESRFSPPIDKSQVRSKLSLPVDEQVILYVGRLSQRKGMPFLESVIDEFNESDETTFVLVGDGDFKQKFENRYPRKLVQMPGYIPYQLVHEYFQSADIYVHPSSFEGIPQTILEAMNCGVPVIARDAGDIGFILEDVITTPYEMADKIRRQNYSLRWKNKNQFTMEFQEKRLQSIITESI
jgi:glycosyltransferase involved in cell wall biosynthesis